MITKEDIMGEVVVEDERRHRICHYINVIRSILSDTSLRKCVTETPKVKCFPDLEFILEEDVLYNMMLSILARDILRLFNADEGVLYNVSISRDTDHLTIYGLDFYYWVKAIPDANTCDKVVLDRFPVI